MLFQLTLCTFLLKRAPSFQGDLKPDRSLGTIEAIHNRQLLVSVCCEEMLWDSLQWHCYLLFLLQLEEEIFWLSLASYNSHLTLQFRHWSIMKHMQKCYINGICNVYRVYQKTLQSENICKTNNHAKFDSLTPCGMCSTKFIQRCIFWVTIWFNRVEVWIMLYKLQGFDFWEIVSISCDHN